VPIVFAPGENCKVECNLSGVPVSPKTGQITAINPDASETLWNLPSMSENAMSGVAVANGVVYYAVVGCDGELRALECNNGKAPGANNYRLGCKRPFSIARTSVCGHGHEVCLRRFHPGQYCCAGPLTISRGVVNGAFPARSSPVSRTPREN
jgi:hypothetical protein